jgi:hypothetical protein
MPQTATESQQTNRVGPAIENLYGDNTNESRGTLAIFFVHSG